MPRWVAYTQLTGEYKSRKDLVRHLKLSSIDCPSGFVVAEDLDVQKLEHIYVNIEDDPPAEKETEKETSPC